MRVHLDICSALGCMRLHSDRRSAQGCIRLHSKGECTGMNLANMSSLSDTIASIEEVLSFSCIPVHSRDPSALS